MENKTNVSLLKVRQLPIFEDLDSMSMVTGFGKQLLYYYGVCENKDKYEIFEVPKRNGFKRTIYAPRYALKILQRWVLENILYKVSCSEYAYAFIKKEGSPLKRNANLHNDKMFLFEMDFQDFFPSISRKKILHLFNNIGYNLPVSNWLSNICTYNGILPQGSATAPYLSNLICLSLDKRISRYCSRRDILYSRYADDLTFSGDDKNKLKMIYGMVKKISKSEGFSLNEDKTRFIGKKCKRTVTGITLSDTGVKAPKEYKKLVRAMIHHCILSGDYSKVDKIRGYVAYICSIEDGYIDKVKTYISKFDRKDVTFLDSTVELFNENKIFNDIEDFEKVKIREDEEEEYCDIVSARFEFLKERKLKMPEEIKLDDRMNGDITDETPFD